ncbi:MAG: heme-binding domain-containing protein [Cyclobacteriaceae bacterium]
MVKKILIGLLLLFVVMQLLQPTRNIAEGITENDITKVYAIPSDVLQVFEQKCYDCHSNNTRYPWYVHVQPVGWWMASHIKDAKDELNFSEFKTYNEKRANHKLEEIVEVTSDGSMPLESYVWLHADAKITAEEASAIEDWVKSLGVVIKEEAGPQ